MSTETHGTLGSQSSRAGGRSMCEDRVREEVRSHVVTVGMCVEAKLPSWPPVPNHHWWELLERWELLPGQQGELYEHHKSTTDVLNSANFFMATAYNVKNRSRHFYGTRQHYSKILMLEPKHFAAMAVTWQDDGGKGGMEGSTGNRPEASDHMPCTCNRARIPEAEPYSIHCLPQRSPTFLRLSWLASRSITNISWRP